jgi:hypothetical protein
VWAGRASVRNLVASGFEPLTKGQEAREGLGRGHGARMLPVGSEIPFVSRALLLDHGKSAARPSGNVALAIKDIFL